LLVLIGFLSRKREFPRLRSRPIYTHLPGSAKEAGEGRTITLAPATALNSIREKAQRDGSI